MSDGWNGTERESAAPANLSEVLSGLVSQFGIGRKREDDELEDVWKELAGELATYSRVSGVRRGALEVLVSDAIFVQELLFRKTELLAELKERLPDSGVEDLRFRIGSVEKSQ